MKIAKIPVIVLCAISFSLGGVGIVIRVQNLDDKKPAVDQRIVVEKDRLRIDFKEAGGGENFAIYRKDKNALFVVNPAGKSYMEMTREDLDKAAERMRQAMEKMREAMKNMPPQQREMMEKMMSGNPGMAGMGTADTAAGPRLEYRKVGPGKVGSWSAVEYGGYRDGVKRARVWVVGFDALGVTRADFEVMKEVGDFSRGLKLGSQADFYGDSEALKGIPVRTVTLDEAGEEHMQIDLIEVKKQAIPASRFELPAGFERKKMEIPDMSGGPRRGTR